jgi:LAS superfamily LD-carboxypeptidase LdcB
METTQKHYTGIWFLSFCVLLLVASSAYGWYTLSKISSDVTTLKSGLASTTYTLELYGVATREEIDANKQSLVTLSDLLYEEQKNSEELRDMVKSQVRKLSGTVETLEKLTTTDPELLQKYSRVYFLNENYKPSDLTVIDEKYDLPNGKEVSIHGDVWPFLKDLLEDAKEDGIELQILSGYRSFGEQASLKETYAIQYGSGANKFSADQGYSEHQLGTTVDFTTREVGENLDSFGGTAEQVWLVKNAYKYGFVMSYPEENEFYQYEPWHWRFVGKDLAKDLHRSEESFYDWEQRTIDSYVPTLFED